MPGIGDELDEIHSSLSLITETIRSARMWTGMGASSGRSSCTDESVARRAGEPAGQSENVLGEFGWVEDLELGTEDGHVDGEHVR